MNAAWLWITAPWADALTWSLVHFLWIGTAWLVFGLMISRWLSRPDQRYALWLCVLAGMALSPVVTFVLQPAATVTNTADVVEFDGADASAAAVDSVPAWQPFVLLFWCLGVLVTSARMIVGAWWVIHITQQLEDWPERWCIVARRLTRQIGLGRLPRLGMSRIVKEPFALQLWRPVVILPASWFTEMPADLIEAVIAHELAHVRRLDLWVNLLQRVIETLLFFHPAVWWVSREIRQQRELCCDTWAASATGRAVEYARALEWVATWRLAGAASPLLATGFGGSRMLLLERIRNVLGLESATESSAWGWGATGIGGLAACAVAFALWNSPVQGNDESESALFSEDVSAGLVAQRDDDRPGPPPPPRRPEPPREGERRPDGPRDGEPRPPGPRDGDRRPDGPRDGGPRPPGPRDGDRRPDGPRDGDPRPPGPRDGDRRPEGPRGERPFPPREGGPREDGPRPPFGEGLQGPPVEAMRDMLRAIHDLRAEVQALRAEVNELRGHRPPPREGGPRGEFREGPAGPPREGDRPRPPEGRGRDEGRPSPEAGRPGPRPEARERGREDGRPPRDGERRPEGERRDGDRPDGERRPDREEREE